MSLYIKNGNVRVDMSLNIKNGNMQVDLLH